MEEGLFGDTPVSRCAFYRRVGGLAAVLEPVRGRITVAAGSVWGLGVSAELGFRVREELRRRQQAMGPVVSHLRSRTWVFLVRPDLPDSTVLFARLYGVGVVLYREGAVIALPSPADKPLTMRRWVEPLRDQYRPSAAVVVAAIGRLLPGPSIDPGAFGSVVRA